MVCIYLKWVFQMTVGVGELCPKQREKITSIWLVSNAHAMEE